MKKELESFLVNDLGIKREVLDLYISEDALPEDHDHAGFVEKWHADNKTIVLSKHGENFFKAKQDEAFKVYKGSQNQKLNQAFELGLTRKEAEEKTPEEILELAKKNWSTAIKNASAATNEDLIKENESWKNKTNEWKEKFEQEASIRKQEVEEANKRAETHIYNHEVNTMFNKYLDTKSWGVDKVQVPEWKERITARVRERYAVGLDGSVMSKDGGDAVNFEENGTYKHISEAVDYLFNYYKLSAVSNSGVGSGYSSSGGAVTTDKMDDASKALLERMRKQGAM